MGTRAAADDEPQRSAPIEKCAILESSATGRESIEHYDTDDSVPTALRETSEPQQFVGPVERTAGAF